MADERWVHVDINSYFATLLQQENPALRGKPVGVVKDVGRTCIIAASKEAKKLGVSTGCLLSEARLKAPGILAVPVNFDICLSATIKLKKIFESLAPDVRIFSLDESFINLTDCSLLYSDAHDFGWKVQTQIKQELGDWVTCNVGISHNRLLAKLASEVSPKGSVTEITQENKALYLAEAWFSQVCGVGFRLEERLKKLRVEHPWQINFVSDEDLLQEFGPFWSVELRKIGQGEETHAFTHQSEVDHMQSIGRSITGYKLCNDELTIKRTLYNLTEEVFYKARKMGLAGRQVGIYLIGSSLAYDSQHWGAGITLKEYIRHTPVMFKLLYEKYQAWSRPWPIIRFAVRMSLLEPVSKTAPLLWPEWHQREQVYQAVDQLSQRYGLFTVRGGTLLNAELFKPEVTGFLGDSQFQLNRLQ